MLQINVTYPLAGGRVVLRTDRDWDRNIEPVSVADDTAEFLIEGDQQFFYFKPLLIREDGTELWSRGENYLAIATSGAPVQIHPYFMAEMHCSVCELMPPLANGNGTAHRFRVFLPAGYYENVRKHYPVLYMHDGQNLFFKEEAFLGNSWRTDEVLGLLDKMNALEQVIVVGILPDDRMHEYTLPGYREYGDWLVHTLKPLVDVKYRTLRGPENTAVMGSSLGGVVSFYLGWEHSDVIGQAACLSSTFTYCDDLLERVATEPKRNLRIYLDSGWPRDNYEPTRCMRDRLLSRGYRAGEDLFYLAFPEAKHDENAWAARSPIPFQFLFGKVPSFARS